MEPQSTLTNPQPQGNLQTGGNPLSDAILQKMLDSSGMISSTTSTIDQRISDAISGIKSSAQSSNQALQSQYGREAGYMMDNANQNQIEGRAAGSGGVMNMAALRELTKTTDKNLNDLEQRKNELVLQNNAQAANKISELQIQALDFKQKAEQQTFANLLGMANVSIQSAQEKRLAESQSFNEKSAIASVGLQYGIPVNQNDTIESITARAAPLASKKQQAELLKIQAETRRIDADTYKARSGDKISSYDPSTIKALAASANSLYQDPAKRNEYNNIIDVVTKQGGEALSTFYKEFGSLQQSNLEKDINISVQKQSNPKLKTGLPGILDKIAGGTLNTITGTSNFITGSNKGLRYNSKTGKMEWVR